MKILKSVIFAGLMISVAAQAADRPYRSFTVTLDVQAGTLFTTGQDEFVDLATARIGAGLFPQGPCVIKGFQLRTSLASRYDYAVVGKTQPFGDWITPMIGPDENTGLVIYPGGGFPFDPSSGALHLHYHLGVGGEAASQLTAVIVYSLNSDQALP